MPEVNREVVQRTGRIPLSKVYLPYLPAIAALVGAVMIALGFLLGASDPANQTYQNLRFIGAGFACLGALWSTHNQIQGAAESKERDQKIADLSEQLRCHLTGGDSFCYGYPIDGLNQQFRWGFIHQGPYPLTDVVVHIFDLGKPIEQQMMAFSPALRLGTLYPGKMATSGLQDVWRDSCGYNLFFIARNGSWTQEIRWSYLPGVLAVANRVIRDGMPLDKPLLLNVSSQFPGRTPLNEAWNDPPPYTANSSEPPSA